MTEFFPGSSRPIAPVPGQRAVVPPARIRTKVGNIEMELYTISEVAEALRRKPVTIRKWEREAVIPKATFVKPGRNGDPRGRRRLYSRAQVEALVEIAESEGILYNLKANISQTGFKRRVFEAFRQIQQGAR